MYRSLDSAKIVLTLERLTERVSQRFPGAGLAKVCAELTELARENDGRAHMLERPNYLLRLTSALILVMGAVMIGLLAQRIEVRPDKESIYSTLQGIDAGLSILIVAFGSALFLATLESRWKRQQALGDLDELRSIIHVIDMHQLTKDPSSVLSSPTPASPVRQLDHIELVRYLDYCSEMLSLAAKVAAVYAQSTRDPTVVAASSDLQQLTANLSSKIWQKIRIAQAGGFQAPAVPGPSAQVLAPQPLASPPAERPVTAHSEVVTS